MFDSSSTVFLTNSAAINVMEVATSRNTMSSTRSNAEDLHLFCWGVLLVSSAAKSGVDCTRLELLVVVTPEAAIPAQPSSLDGPAHVLLSSGSGFKEGFFMVDCVSVVQWSSYCHCTVVSKWL